MITTRPDVAPHARHRGLVLLTASLGFAVIQLDVSVVNVAVKPIGASLGGGVTGLQWVVDAYTVAFAALILTAGALGDRLGARAMCLTGFAVFTAASAGCGMAPSLPALIAARGVQGIGAAMLGACTLVLLSHAYPGPARARAVGLWALGASAALAAGPVVGGLLITAAGWRAIFFINLPLGLLGIWLTARYATETPRARDRALDLPGQLLAIATVAALASAAIEAGPLGWVSPAVLAGFAIAAAAGIAFVLTERRRTSPMLPVGLFGQRAFTVSVATGLAVNIAFYGLIFVASLFLQRQLGFSALAAGAAFVPVMAAIMVSNVAAGRVTRVLGTRGCVATGALTMALGCADITGFPPSVAPVVAGLALAGLGIGLIVPAITSRTLGAVDPSRSGIASGTLTAFRQSGSVLGVALFGTVLASAGPTAGLRTTAGLSAALGAGVLVLAPLDSSKSKPRRT